MLGPGGTHETTQHTMTPRPSEVLDAAQREFVAERRSATLATLARSGQPRLVPICFVLRSRDAEGSPALLYSPLDEKPKRGHDVRRLARVRDITERPEVTLLFERWSEDRSRLAWLRARGLATLVEPHEDVEAHRDVVHALRVKYPQYREHGLERLPMIRITIVEATWWSADATG